MERTWIDERSIDCMFGVVKVHDITHVEYRVKKPVKTCLDNGVEDVEDVDGGVSQWMPPDSKSTAVVALFP